MAQKYFQAILFLFLSTFYLPSIAGDQTGHTNISTQKIRQETTQYCQKMSYLLGNQDRSISTSNSASELDMSDTSSMMSDTDPDFSDDESVLLRIEENRTISDNNKLKAIIQKTPCEKHEIKEKCLAFFGCGWGERVNKCLHLPENCHEMKNKESCSGFLGCFWRVQTNDCTQNVTYMEHQKRCYGWSQEDCTHFGNYAGCRWANNQCLPLQCNASLQTAMGCTNKPGCTNYMLLPSPECPVKKRRECGPIHCNQFEMNECRREPVCQWAQNQCLQRDAFIPINMIEALKHAGVIALGHLFSFVGGVLASIVAAL